MSLKYLSHLEASHLSHKGLQPLLRLITSLQEQCPDVTPLHLLYLRHCVESRLYPLGLAFFRRFHLHAISLSSSQTSQYILCCAVILFKMDQLEMFVLYMQIHLQLHDSDTPAPMHTLLGQAVSFKSFSSLQLVIRRARLDSGPLVQAVDEFLSTHAVMLRTDLYCAEHCTM